MGDFFTSNPLTVQFVHDTDGVLLRERRYDVTDRRGRPLGRAHEDLGHSAPLRLLRGLGRRLVDSRTVVLDDPQGRTLLTLIEHRFRTKSRTEVLVGGNRPVGTVTREIAGFRRRFTLRDSRRRRLATITAGPKSRFNRYVVHGPGGRRLARIDRERRREAGVLIPSYTLRIGARAAADPLGALLRASALVVDFAELRDDG